MRYQHTQNGKLIKWIMGATIALCLIIAGLNGWSSTVGLLLYCVVFFMVVLSWLFGSLTVEIDGEELRHFFGPGFWKKTYLLSEIESVKQVRNSWMYGWGIRLTPYGWLYNVSGLDAVQIQLRSERVFRIGTDDSEDLLICIHDSVN